VPEIDQTGQARQARQETGMRITRFLSAAMLVVGLGLVVAPQAGAVTKADFTQAAFVDAQKQGKPVLVYIEASWCPTCAKQRPILAQLEQDPAFRDLVIYQVDFDTQKDVVRQMGARMQSTLVVFHGTEEKGRSTGDTNVESIRALLTKANL
jgi:thioredoxin 1